MSPERRATAILFATTLFWGSSFLAMLWGLRGLEPAVGARAAPFAFLFLRFLFALPLHAALFPGSLRALSGRTIGAGLLLSLPFNAGFILQTVALRWTTSTISAFLTSLFVVLTPVIGRAFFAERLVPATLAGGLVSLAGVWILTDPAGGLGLGEILTLLCAVAFAFQIQLTNVVTRKHPPEAITFVMFASAVAVSGIALLALGIGPGDLLRGLGGPRVPATTLYTAAVCSVAAFWALNRFQRDISPTRAGVLYMLEPVVAALLAVAFDGEPMTPRKLAGGAVIVGGNLLCELIGRRSVNVPTRLEQ
ncbi:MAG TPA: DMT family transporter [Planctomycetota bacterium]